MPIRSHKLGPGTLHLGPGPLDVSLQVTACKITPSEEVSSTDAIKVLGGEELAGTETVRHNYVLSGTFLTDLAASGVVAWSWANAGTPQVFEFEPETASGASFSGTLVPVPLEVGGDEVEAGPMTTDFTWRCTGAAPVPTWGA